MDYTKFHIGIYISLTAAAIALVEIKPEMAGFVSIKIAIACFVIAGTSGGVIAGNIPLYGAWTDFEEAPIGPWGCSIWRFRRWAHIEHTAFWIGVLAVVLELGFISH